MPVQCAKSEKGATRSMRLFSAPTSPHSAAATPKWGNTKIIPPILVETNKSWREYSSSYYSCPIGEDYLLHMSGVCATKPQTQSPPLSWSFSFCSGRIDFCSWQTQHRWLSTSHQVLLSLLQIRSPGDGVTNVSNNSWFSHLTIGLETELTMICFRRCSW